MRVKEEKEEKERNEAREKNKVEEERKTGSAASLKLYCTGNFLSCIISH